MNPALQIKLKASESTALTSFHHQFGDGDFYFRAERDQPNFNPLMTITAYPFDSKMKLSLGNHYDNPVPQVIFCFPVLDLGETTLETPGKGLYWHELLRIQTVILYFVSLRSDLNSQIGNPEPN